MKRECKVCGKHFITGRGRPGKYCYEHKRKRNENYRQWQIRIERVAPCAEGTTT